MACRCFMGFEIDGSILKILKAISCKSKITSASTHPFGLQCRHTHMAKYVIWVIGLVMQPGSRENQDDWHGLFTICFFPNSCLGKTKLEGEYIGCPGRSGKLRAIDFKSSIIVFFLPSISAKTLHRTVMRGRNWPLQHIFI